MPRRRGDEKAPDKPAAPDASADLSTDTGAGDGDGGEAKECRVCLGEERAHDLIAPCLCRGSAMWIHRKCLDEWRATAPGGSSGSGDSGISAFSHCPSCEFRYEIVDPNFDPVKAHAALKRYRLLVARDLAAIAFAALALVVAFALLLRAVDSRVLNGSRAINPVTGAPHQPLHEWTYRLTHTPFLLPKPTAASATDEPAVGIGSPQQQLADGSADLPQPQAVSTSAAPGAVVIPVANFWNYLRLSAVTLSALLGLLSVALMMRGRLPLFGADPCARVRVACGRCCRCCRCCAGGNACCAGRCPAGPCQRFCDWLLPGPAVTATATAAGGGAAMAAGSGKAAGAGAGASTAAGCCARFALARFVVALLGAAVKALAVVGAVSAVAVGAVLVQRAIARHVHVLWLRSEARKLVVADQRHRTIAQLFVVHKQNIARHGAAH